MEQKIDYNLHRIQSLVNNGEDLENLDNYYDSYGGMPSKHPETSDKGIGKGHGSAQPPGKRRDTLRPTHLPSIDTTSSSTGSSTISSLFLEEITAQKKDFLRLNSTQYLINQLTDIFDKKLNDQIKDTYEIEKNVFACLDFNKLFEGGNTSDNIKQFIKSLKIYDDTSTLIDKDARNYLEKVIKDIKSDVDDKVKKATEANRSSTIPITNLDGGSNKTFNALLINNQINKTSNTINPYNTRAIDPVENDTMDIHELQNNLPTDTNIGANIGGKGGIVNFVNKKTRRKKYKKPKKITRRRLNQK